MDEADILDVVGGFYGEVYSQVMRFMPRIVGSVESEYGVRLDSPAVDELTRRVVHATLCSFAGELQRNEDQPGTFRFYIDNAGEFEVGVDDRVDPILGWLSMVDERGILKPHVSERLPQKNYLE